MKTSRAMRISTVLKLIALVMAFVSIVLLSACDENAEKTVIKAGVKNVPDVLYVSELDAEMQNIREAVNNSGIKLYAEYDDGTYIETPFDFNMLDEVFKEQLNTEGTHSVIYMYKGQRTEFEITIEISTTYKVRFYNNSGKVISEQRVAKGGAAEAPAASSVAVEGKDFLSWDKSFDNVTSDMDIYPVYAAKTYTVNFYDKNGNLIDTRTVNHGGSIVGPEAPEIRGYDFVEWDKSLNNIKSNLSVRPVYELKTFTVRFYNCEGTLISEQFVKYCNSAVEPSEADRAVSGLRFVSWDCDFSNVTEDLNVIGIYEGAISVKFYNCKNELIAIKYVSEGGSVDMPSDAEIFVPGFSFVRWDNDLTNIQKDIEVYGIYLADKTTDTDGDGLTDYIEAEVLGLDYSKVDTDGDGIVDGDEDCDGDGLPNIYEIVAKLDPANADTDGDGLNDGDEINKYWTLPADPDTDGDGANDGWEISNNFDPCVYNASFEVKVEVAMPDNTQIKVDIPELPGEYAGTTIIEQSENSAIKDVHGSIGEPINYNVSAPASITLVSDEAAKAEDPVLMYFNTKTNQVEPITVKVSGNEVTATITEYGSYVLVDRKVFEEKGQWRDVFDSSSYTAIEVILVIDDSGSLGGDYGYNSATGAFRGGNDPTHQRLVAAKQFIASATEAVKIGIVKFDNSYNVVKGLTQCTESGKDTLSSYLNINNGVFDSKGSTYMYGGLNLALNQFSSSPDTLKIIIVFTDGAAHDDSQYSSVVNKAINNDVKIYSVGLGSFRNNLETLSSATGGKCHTTENSGELVEIFKDIKETIDMTADTDSDGISDFFESGVDKNGVPTLPTINGMDFKGLDKNNPDTDGDGYLDGQEIEVYLYYSTTREGQVMVWGIVNSNPLDPESVPAGK